MWVSSKAGGRGVGGGGGGGGVMVESGRSRKEEPRVKLLRFQGSRLTHFM